MTLLEQQSVFFRALCERRGGAVPGLKGRLDVYRYAYFERVRASIVEDFPLLFAVLDSTEFVWDLLEREPSTSWTLAEMSARVIPALEARGESAATVGLARLDQAERLAGWLEEWLAPTGPSTEWIPRFAQGELRVTRTKTWQEAEGRCFWRSDDGVVSVEREAVNDPTGLFPEFSQPRSFSELTEIGSENPAALAEFIHRGISESWLRVTSEEGTQ